MITKAFAIYDSKALMYNAPFFMAAVGQALRAFSDASNDPNLMFNKHPGDYQLYEIGSFDDNTAVLTSMVPMKLLGCAADFIKSKPIVYSPDPVKDMLSRPLATVSEIDNGSSGS